MNLTDLVLLLLLLVVVVLFWNWRRQEEQARHHAQRVCQQHELQLLDLARQSGRLVLHRGPAWRAEFSFGFSSDGETRYEGVLTLHNLQLADVALPAHRVNAPPEVNIHYH